MRLLRLVRALGLALAAASAASAQSCPTVITGPIPCGFNCTYNNVDVVIQDVQIDQSCGPCSFTVTVRNGTITVNGFNGLNGDGANGADAIARLACDGLNTPATSPRAGCSITLRSLKPLSGPATRPLGITAYATISAKGGNGGKGSSVDVDRLNLVNCDPCYAGSSVPGTPGANGGNVTLISDGLISTSFIHTDAGFGGDGAPGCQGIYGPAGQPSAGQAGGKGGNISVSQSGTAVGPEVSSLSASGGKGGRGGDGATGTSGSTAGANGATGGAGGTITVSGFEPSLRSVSTFGGAGGDGGKGANAVDLKAVVCEDCLNNVTFHLCPVTETGRDGGSAGHGGAGGPLTVAATRDVLLTGPTPYWKTGGGAGARGGEGGMGIYGFADCPSCDASPGCGHGIDCPGVTAHGNPGASGNGGVGAKISVKARTLVAGGVEFNTTGGCGGNGQHGLEAKCVLRKRILYPPNSEHCGSTTCPCTVGSIVCTEISAVQGASGGTGGASGSISLVLSVPMGTPPLYVVCGGGGGAGGNGGAGFTCSNWVAAPAAGGQGGLAGASGAVAVTGQPSMVCIAPTTACGTQVAEGDDAIVYRGLPGNWGVLLPGCPCTEN